MRLDRIVLSLAIAVFAVTAAANGLDRMSNGGRGIQRAVPRLFRAQAARSAAALDIVMRQRGQALLDARAAVEHDPVDPDSSALLGSALLANGSDVAAAAAFRVAGRLGWRNLATQLYWFGAAMEVGDDKVAGDRLDAILRTHPGFPEADELFAALESDPTGREVLLEHLASKPRWLFRYMKMDSTTPFDVVQRRVDMLESLGTANRSLGCKSVLGMSRALIVRGERELATRVWNSNCPNLAVREGIVDPGFDLIDAEETTPFGWFVYRSGDVLIRTVAAPKGGKRLVLQNRAPDMQLALEQPVVLTEGSYRISATIGAEDAGPSNQLVASIGCTKLPVPPPTGASLSGSGQILIVPQCDRQLLGIWIRPGGASVSLDSLQLHKIE